MRPIERAPIAPLSVLLAALLAGCATAPEPTPLEPPPPLAQVRVAVAPLRLQHEPTATRPTFAAGERVLPNERLACTACEEPIPSPPDGPRPACPGCGGTTSRAIFSAPWRPALDGERVAARALELLADRGAALGVEQLPAAPGEADVARPAHIETARARRHDLLFEAVIEDARAELVGTTGAQGLKIALLVVCSVAIFPPCDPPNWFIASEVYGITCTGRWRVSDVATGELLREGPLRSRTTATFAELGPGPTREWHVVGFLRAPGCLDEEEWTEIGDQLLQVAHEDLARELVRVAESAFSAR